MKNIFCKCEKPNLYVEYHAVGHTSLKKYQTMNNPCEEQEYSVDSIECQKCGTIEDGGDLDERANDIFVELQE